MYVLKIMTEIYYDLKPVRRSVLRERELNIKIKVKMYVKQTRYFKG